MFFICAYLPPLLTLCLCFLLLSFSFSFCFVLPSHPLHPFLILIHPSIHPSQSHHSMAPLTLLLCSYPFLLCWWPTTPPWLPPLMWTIPASSMVAVVTVSPSKPQDLAAAGQHEARNCLSRQSSTYCSISFSWPRQRQSTRNYRFIESTVTFV